MFNLIKFKLAIESNKMFIFKLKLKMFYQDLETGRDKSVLKEIEVRSDVTTFIQVFSDHLHQTFAVPEASYRFKT